MRRALGAIVLLLCGIAVAADATPYTMDSGPMMARAEQWYQRSPVYNQNACFRTGTGYARTDWKGVLGGCHLPYYRASPKAVKFGGGCGCQAP